MAAVTSCENALLFGQGSEPMSCNIPEVSGSSPILVAKGVEPRSHRVFSVFYKESYSRL